MKRFPCSLSLVTFFITYDYNNIMLFITQEDFIFVIHYILLDYN
jgi:hypothetical protein